MLPSFVLPRLTTLAVLAVWGLSGAPLVHAADAATAAATPSQPRVSADIRPTVPKPTFFKRKEAVKEVPKTQVQGVSMDELADLIDQKISEVTAQRAVAPVVKVKTPAPRAKRAAAGSDPARERWLAGRAPGWAYSGATGPESWGQLKPAYRQCMLGKRQSPIDIRDGFQVHLDPIQFDYRPTRFRVIDNGHTVQVNLDLGNSITVLGQRYELQQFHFHRPSEERVNGRAYPMSAHLLHKSPSGQYAVVAVLLEQGEPHPLIQQVWNNLPLEPHQAQAALAPMDPSQILPPQRAQYYTYMGSLTSPPCTENVLWMVMKQPVTVSVEQIEIFHRLYPMNARPVQPTAGRMIKEGL